MSLWPAIVALPCGLILLKVFGIARSAHGTVDLWHIRRSTASWLVYDVNGITLSQEVLRPALTSVRRLHVKASRNTTTVDHHHWIGTRLFGRNQELRIDLAAHYFLAFDLRILPACVYIAYLCNGQRCSLLGPHCDRKQQ